MGYIQLIIDKRGDNNPDHGQAVPEGTHAFIIERNSGQVIPKITGKQGMISVDQIHMGDRIYCRSVAYSFKSPRGGEHEHLSVFDLSMDTCRLANLPGTNTLALAHHSGFSLAQSNSIIAGGTVKVMLSHPVWSWNLIVALDWEPTSGEVNDYVTGLKLASNYLFRITHGHMKIGQVRLYKNVPQSSDLFIKHADVQVFSANNVHPWSGIDGWNNGASIKMWGTSPNPVQSGWWTVLVHEIGHYFLGLSDEYYDGNGDIGSWSAFRAANRQEVPDNYGLMDNQSDMPELSGPNDYLASYANRPINEVTAQVWHHRIKEGAPFTHRSCWDYLFDRFDNSNGKLPNWDKYGGIRARINMPLAGSFQGRNADGTERRSVADQRGPENYFPLRIGPRTVWQEAQVTPYFYKRAVRLAPGVTGIDEREYAGGIELLAKHADGKAITNARVWLLTDSGRIELGRTNRSGRLISRVGNKGDILCLSWEGKVYREEIKDASVTVNIPKRRGITDGPPATRVLITASVKNGPRGAYNFSIKILAGKSLAELPKVLVRPGFGKQVELSTREIVPGNYEGIFSDKSNALSGSIDVIAMDHGHAIETSATYQVLRIPDGFPETPAKLFNSIGTVMIDLRSSKELKPGSLAIMVEGGQASSISEKEDRIADAVSFDVEGGHGNNFSMNWILDHEQWIDKDSTTLKIHALDNAQGNYVWGPALKDIHFSTGVSGKIIMSVKGPVGTYAVFGTPLKFRQPLPPVEDLTVVHGTSPFTAIVHWTAPGEGNEERPVQRYLLYYSHQPIDSENIFKVIEYPIRLKPGVAGSEESIALRLPPGTDRYYFVIQSMDRAGNISELSNVARLDFEILVPSEPV